jgi:mercuric ion binding protein
MDKLSLIVLIKFPVIQPILFIINFKSMKQIRFIVAVLAIILASTGLYAQNQDKSAIAASKTETIKVGGNCDLCKTRIEKAAKIEGVNQAEWNKDTKVLKLVYNPSKVTSDVVQKKIAAVGHDTEKYKADDKIYNSLPGCCKYR